MCSTVVVAVGGSSRLIRDQIPILNPKGVSLLKKWMFDEGSTRNEMIDHNLSQGGQNTIGHSLDRLLCSATKSERANSMDTDSHDSFPRCGRSDGGGAVEIYQACRLRSHHRWSFVGLFSLL